jgi:hypothetical protein
MTDIDFNTQYQRLVKHFGKTAMSEEKAILIWREVREYDASWFGRVIDHMIGNLRQAPIMVDFREWISKERERRWDREKRMHEVDAKEAMSRYTPEQIKMMCQEIRQRIQGAA